MKGKVLEAVVPALRLRSEAVPGSKVSLHAFSLPAAATWGGGQHWGEHAEVHVAGQGATDQTGWSKGLPRGTGAPYRKVVVGEASLAWGVLLSMGRPFLRGGAVENGDMCPPNLPCSVFTARAAVFHLSLHSCCPRSPTNTQIF